MRTEKATKKITQSGDSLVINVTKEVNRLGLGRGDDVDITLSSAMGDDLAFIVRAMTNALNGWIDNISLNYYEIETNSTGSKIQIVAEETYLSEYPSERQGFRPFSCIFQEKLRILQFIRRLMA